MAHTPAELLAKVQELDPEAKLTEHRWGFLEIHTEAFPGQTVLISGSRIPRVETSSGSRPTT